MRVGVTLTSSLSVDAAYIQLTNHVAEYLANKHVGIVYGGTAYGMMLELGRAYKQAGGKDLVGVMAEDLKAVTKNYIAYDELDESYLEETMTARQHRIASLADAFIILPGGYGTLEEIGTFIGGRVNKLYDKPIAIYNYDHFYDTFIEFLDEMQCKSFSKIALRDVVFVSDNMDEIFTYLSSYAPQELADKFV
jgi:uncharacterized protein (TIGR00730 family)